jgi:hypothetical protein
METLMPDRFDNHTSSLVGPASHGFAITPSDVNDLEETTRALYVGGAGDIVLALVSGAELTIANVAAGTVLPLRTNAVKATGTTATALVGLV